MFSPRRALATLSLLALAGAASPALANTPAPAPDDDTAAQRGFSNPNIKRMSKVPRNTDVTKVAPRSGSKVAAKAAASNDPSKRSSVQATASRRISIVGENTVAAHEHQRQQQRQAERQPEREAATAKPKSTNSSLAMQQQRTVTRQSSVAQRVSQQQAQTKVVTQSSLNLAEARTVTNSSAKVREGKAIGRTSAEIRENATITRSSKMSREIRSTPTASPTVMRVAPAGERNAQATPGTRNVAKSARKVAVASAMRKRAA
jgi:hypothetical protein